MATTSSTLTDVLQTARNRIPGFDWLKLDRVGMIRIELPEEETGIRLVVHTRHPIPEGDTPVVLQFDGVRDLRLPVLTGFSFAFGELVVRDVRAQQLEGIRFQVEDYLEDLTFYCKTISVLKSPPLDTGDY